MTILVADPLWNQPVWACIFWTPVLSNLGYEIKVFSILNKINDYTSKTSSCTSSNTMSICLHVGVIRTTLTIKPFGYVKVDNEVVYRNVTKPKHSEKSSSSKSSSASSSSRGGRNGNIARAQRDARVSAAATAAMAQQSRAAGGGPATGVWAGRTMAVELV